MQMLHTCCKTSRVYLSMFFDERLYIGNWKNELLQQEKKKCDQLMEADDVLKSQYAFINKVFTQTLLFIDDIPGNGCCC